jgi:hypothetical protein
MRKINMKRFYNSLLACLLVAFAFAGSSAAVYAADESNSKLKYRVYSFEKPVNFTTLQEFINDTYADTLDQGTVRDTTVDGQPAVSYWTDDGGVREFNLLMEDNTGLKLMTSAHLSFSRDVEPSTGSASLGTPARSLQPMTAFIGPVMNSCTTGSNGTNCVAYVRCLAPWLPKIDLTTFVAKKSLINSSVPSVGAVAVIQVSGQFAVNGHLAYITGVNYNAKGQVTTITITESHYLYTNGYDIRTDTPANLHVVGYVVRK